MPDLKVYTPEEAARVLKCKSVRTIYNRLRAGHMPGRKVGNHWLIEEEALRKWITEGPPAPEDLTQPKPQVP